MSFGFSVGDFLAVLTLANKIRKDFSGAPAQFKDIAQDVRSLTIVIQDANAHVDQMSESQAANFQEILSACYTLLQRLRDVLVNCSIVAEPQKGKKTTRLWKRLRWRPEEIAELRSQITSKITLLNAYNDQATSHNVAKLVQHSDDKTRRALLEWVSSVDYITQQNYLTGRLQIGSRKWLFDSDKYSDWRKSKGQILYCPGDPGTGKTFTTAMVVETLQAETQSKDNHLCTYVYCTYQTHDQDIQSLLCSLLRNALHQALSIPDSIISLCEERKKANRPFLRDEILNILELLYKQFDRVNLIVDALDELPIQVGRPFIADLLKLRDKSGVNLFVTSRPIPELQHPFAAQGALFMEIRASDEDVHQYLKDAMFQLPGFVRRSPALQTEIITTITKASDGMFLLAELHLRSLTYKKSLTALRTALSRLSIGSDAYDKAYEDSMARIAGLGPDSENLAKQALLILSCARQPLQPEDLAYSLSVEPDSTAIDDDNVPDMEDVVRVCAGLVIIDTESNLVRLVHKSTQEYFERNRSRWFPNANKAMAHLCIQYKEMATAVFASSPERDRRELPFWQYADANWAYHALLANGGGEIAREKAPDALKNSDLSTSFYSLSRLAVSLLAKDVAGSLHSALVNACRERRYALVDLLLTVNSYDLNRTARLLDPTLFPVNNQGSISDTTEALTKVVLAEPKGNPRQKKRFRKTRLWSYVKPEWYMRDDDILLIIAILGNDRQMVELLLSHGADPNIPDCDGNTAMMVAARYGHEDLLSYLLSIPSIKTDHDSTVSWPPLLWAVRYGHLGCVKLLLDRVDRNYRDDSGVNAACIAAGNGHLDLLKELLKWSDVELDSDPETNCPSALEVAMKIYQWEAVMLLIPLSDCNSKWHDGSMALHYSVAMRRLDAVRLLLAQNNVDVNARDRKGSTLLHVLTSSSEQADIDLLNTLEGAGIDVNIQDNKGHTALITLATTGCNMLLANYLLSRQDTDLTLKDERGNTVLLLAASRLGEVFEAEVLVRALMRDPRVDKHHANKKGRNVLYWLIKGGSEGMIRDAAGDARLAADFAKVFDDGGTLLLYAAKYERSLEVTRLLQSLSPPKFMDLPDKRGDTPRRVMSRTTHKVFTKWTGLFGSP
ncbi:ankyrin repeat-containing domain protein [Stachybotrys elegans]|uniref:Ankyrin repeat-containing domain protein n=1 Tax=Stachybotrys elegans TaxID=80388 RepID=A0A8K0WMY7_9HYPO|nr:ankyrin repeat-containing domain protein [Stachybotrys elegans]